MKDGAVIISRDRSETEICRIMKAYEKSDRKPMIENANNAFKIMLPNVIVQYAIKESAGGQVVLLADVREM
ncbi:MAG: hypothetical protein K2N82_01390 [Lachnospiraceae bacterium]|nr:hypothetical protein [Lachnospiraceae bacterium]